MKNSKVVEMKSDEYGECLYIDGSEMDSSDGESFEVPFTLVKEAPVSKIPYGVSLELCNYVIGSSELYNRNPLVRFSNSKENGVVATLESAFFPESEDMYSDALQLYFKEKLKAARSSLKPLLDAGRVIAIDDSVHEEITYVHCSIKMDDQSFLEAEQYMSEIEDRIQGAFRPSTLFVCHSSEDKPFVERLVAQLDRQGLHIWYDKREIFVGESIVKRISEGLTNADFLVAVLSQSSLSKPWVEREINSSLMRQVQREEIKLLPVRLDNCQLPTLLADIKYADFRNSFEFGLKGLVESIRKHTHQSKFE